MLLKRSSVLGASMVALALITTACGSTGGPASSSSSPKGTITIASFNFSESIILAHIYGGALKNKGYTVNYKDKLGNREIVEPALLSGQIDLYAGYAATDLTFAEGKLGVTADASSDAAHNVERLNAVLNPKGVKALDPSPAVDQNAFAVTKAEADSNHLVKLSDVSSVASGWTLGGPPECPQRPFCQPGLEQTYGLHFKGFKALDAGGPLTYAAFKSSAINIGLVFSSDGGISANNLVVLQDDKHLQQADNIVPLIRSAVDNSEVTSVLNSVDAKLNTIDLTNMNKSADVDKNDPTDIANTWVTSHGF
ncbi:MAG: ABC transporter substrate-binding protein [Chloroflexi bacterium]|nr:MAG: ABC transporter substrate-binding protein [Chloroflexota bacterium]TME48621.1 MAG: ABC transporter substrate-binding protein [Chloroflexota bacterium]